MVGNFFLLSIPRYSGKNGGKEVKNGNSKALCFIRKRTKIEKLGKILKSHNMIGNYYLVL